MIVWVIAGLLGLATGVRIGWALVNKQSLVSTAMIVALGSLAIVAALNWQPLTLLLDTLLRWPNISVCLSQIALVASAAGSFVMIIGVGSELNPAVVRRIALAQYLLAALIAIVACAVFFSGARQPEMSPPIYLDRNLGTATALSWLVPLLYVLLVLTLVVWVGLRYSNRTRRGRALFVFTVGIVLILLASAFFMLQALGSTGLLSVGTAVTMLGCAMAMVAVGSLLPTVEDWFAGRRELRSVEPLLIELLRRQPDVGIGVRPRGPVAFRVAEKLSLISDALFLEATAARGTRVTGGGRGAPSGDHGAHALTDGERPAVSPHEQSGAIARWIYAGRDDRTDGDAQFPGMEWLHQPDTHSDREWILEIAHQYRTLAAP